MPRIGMFALFGAQWAPLKASWALTIGPRPIGGPENWAQTQPIWGLGWVGLWALWALRKSTPGDEAWKPEESSWICFVM